MIKVFEDKGQQLVDARELHGFLEVARDFSTWIKDRIDKYRFVEGRDYIILDGRPELDDTPEFDSPNRGNQSRGGDRRSKDYALTLDMAKGERI